MAQLALDLKNTADHSILGTPTDSPRETITSWNLSRGVGWGMATNSKIFTYWPSLSPPSLVKDNCIILITPSILTWIGQDLPGQLGRKSEPSPFRLARVQTWWSLLVNHQYAGVFIVYFSAVNYSKHIGLKQQVFIISASGLRHLEIAHWEPLVRVTHQLIVYLLAGATFIHTAGGSLAKLTNMGFGQEYKLLVTWDSPYGTTNDMTDSLL